MLSRVSLALKLQKAAGSTVPTKVNRRIILLIDKRYSFNHYSPLLPHQ